MLTAFFIIGLVGVGYAVKQQVQEKDSKKGQEKKAASTADVENNVYQRLLD